MQKHIINCLIAGIVAMLPILGFILFVGFMENQIASAGLREMKFYFPGMGLVVCIIIVYLFGLVVTTLIGKWLWAKLDQFFSSIPVLGQMYQAIKEILGYDTTKESVFKKVVMLPAYGGCGEELGLVTSSFQKDSKKMLIIFVPSAPVLAFFQSTLISINRYS